MYKYLFPILLIFGCAEAEELHSVPYAPPFTPVLEYDLFAECYSAVDRWNAATGLELDCAEVNLEWASETLPDHPDWQAWTVRSTKTITILSNMKPRLRGIMIHEIGHLITDSIDHAEEGQVMYPIYISNEVILNEADLLMGCANAPCTRFVSELDQSHDQPVLPQGPLPNDQD